MPSGIDLTGVFNKSPEEIVNQFRDKGYAISWNWRDVWQESHSRAFTVAKAVNQNVLEDIRGEVDRALDEGTTYREFQKNLEPRLKELGWWGKRELINPETGEVTEVQLGSPWRLKNIYRTNLSTSYSAGRYKTQQAAAARRPWWIYRTAGDTNVRPSHSELAGTVVRYDDPFWDTHYPPNDWGCRCGVDSLSDRQLEARGLTPASGENIAPFAGEGWRYNPGAAPWKPLTPPQISLGDILPLTENPFDTPGPVAALPKKPISRLPEGQDPAVYVDEFLGNFENAGIGRTAIFDDVTGNPVLISDDLFRNADGNLDFPGGQNANLLADAIKDPGEIWLNWMKDSEGYRLNRSYVSRFDVDGAEQLLSFDWMDGRWMFRLFDQTEADQVRTGFLHYKKEE